MKPETIVKKYGYEYHLIPTDRKEYPPKFMGYEGFVLKAVKKIKK